MMRSKAASSMQKTYDECYLTCSTAVYFEGQNNEAEALRSWRAALEQIYYHNAYRVPSSYVPRSETEKALQESLKQLEIQCKERVDLLAALEQSRKDAAKAEKSAAKEEARRQKTEKGKRVSDSPVGDQLPEWLGEGTIPPVQYPDLSKPVPPLPKRPPLAPRQSSETMKGRTKSLPQLKPSLLSPTLTLPVPEKHASRSPSPEHSHKKTMLTTLRRTEKRGFRSPRTSAGQQARWPAPLKAAGMAWDSQARSASAQLSPTNSRTDVPDPTIQARLEAVAARKSFDTSRAPPTHEDDAGRRSFTRVPDPSDYIPQDHWRDTSASGATTPPSTLVRPLQNMQIEHPDAPETSATINALDLEPDPRPKTSPHYTASNPVLIRSRPKSPHLLSKPPDIYYRREYPSAESKVPPSTANAVLAKAQLTPASIDSDSTPAGISRKPVASSSTPRADETRSSRPLVGPSSWNGDGGKDRRPASESKKAATRSPPRRKNSARPMTPASTDGESPDSDNEKSAWDKRVQKLMQNLPKGVDENAAKQIFNEIVVQGDEVHWEDVAGLDGAKKALKEAVVYPFLRPDLFMGLREPARGMLLFGPPGTGKTMLARAVATESRSTFFAISASSLTSKWHGESEKLVRALFALAKALAPSIIFVDEIDSLLSARSSGSEHEASRRSKTEFLIQWSDLQRAAAGREQTKGEGDPSRVLVLAATNVPWDIDEAARRRFVRRQYIPLPEAETREVQLRGLLGHQKHCLNSADIEVLVQVTDGFSGSDITALAKDAAMGPLRNLGEALLYTPMEQIRAIRFEDFEASLVNIRPSVSKLGIKEYEDWAKEFGERGG